MNDKNGRPFIHVVSKDIYLFTSRSNYLPHREIAISRRPDEAGGPASAGAGIGIGQGGKMSFGHLALLIFTYATL